MINLNGFYIKELILTGDSVESAIVSFEKGLNVIHGPSDTGKTFIFQCIQFLLGKSKIPKRIPESKQYQYGYLQLKTYQNKDLTLKRALDGGDFYVYDVAYNLISSSTEKKLNKNKTLKLLLDICNMSDKKARYNEGGTLNNITFRKLHEFFLLEETELQLEMSPIAKIQRTDKTYLTNIFKFLITEFDDSNIIKKVDDTIIKTKKNRLEFLDELVITAEADLEEFFDNSSSIKEQIDKLDNSIKEYKNKNIELKEIYNKSDEERKLTEKKIKGFISRQNYLKELLKRAKILEEQYNSDINRLRSNIEVSISLEKIGTGSCPICKNQITEEDIDINAVIQSSLIEIKKIDILKNELSSTIKMFKNENTELDDYIDQEKKILNILLQSIEEDINKSLREISNKLTEFLDKKSMLKTAEVLQKKLNKYLFDREEIRKYLNQVDNGDINTFQKLDSIMVEGLINIIKDIMTEINFPNCEKVLFSEKELDLIIGEKPRQSFGKGYRALIYTIFILGLFKLLKTKNHQIGLVVFDSPLVTYKPKKKITYNEAISDDLAQNIYTYTACNFKDLQIIIIENIAPIDKKYINEIEFTKTKGIGRYGFIPNIYN
jgi:hypothetical protein